MRAVPSLSILDLKVPTCPVEKPAPFLKYSSVAEMEKKKNHISPGGN